jgi:tetratricopeptide (TPR) repeat protein
LASAERSAYRALALDASLSEAHGALGNVLRNSERPGAEDAYRRALELNPNNAIATHDYAVLLSGIEGRERDGAAMNERVLELDPRSPIAWANKLARVLETDGVPLFREQFTKALQVFADDADGLSALGLAGAASLPFEAMQLAYAIKAAGGDRASVLQVMLDPLIALGQYDEAIAGAEEIMASAHVDVMAVRPHLLLAVGLKGDAGRLDRMLADTTPVPVPNHFKFAVSAFWYIVLGQYEDAAAALATAGHVEEGGGWPMGSSMERGAVPALMRLYAAQGREREARDLAARFRQFLKTPRRQWAWPATDEVLLAGVAAAEGERADAVRHLQEAMKVVPVPELFYPQLPWFQSLAGEPGYAELVAELERRRASILVEVAALEKAAARRRP